MEMEITLSVSFGYESNDEIRKLLDDFSDSCETWTDATLENFVKWLLKNQKKKGD